MKNVYYFTKKIYQFSQSKPIFSALGGTVLSSTEFPITSLYYLMKNGPFRLRVCERSFKRLVDAVRGVVLCHSGDYVIPPAKNYRRVFVYHGTSDKVFDAKGPDNKLMANWFEYYLATGEKDLYKLRKYTFDPENLEGKIVKIGMFRSDPILNKTYSVEKILQKYHIEKKDDRKIILYAPTWSWGGGTLRECFDTFAKEITKYHTLIVRPHFNDKEGIRHMLEWQKNNRNKHLYIFRRQHEDVMDFIYISDLLIGDNSSVNYDFALTKKPIVLVDSCENKSLFIPPDEYNIKLCCPLYIEGRDNILDKIEEAFSNPIYRNRIERLVDRSFYFNDGHAVDRACSFIVDTLDKMRLIDKEETLKKIKDKFTYIERTEYE
jgi:hypothetical protein